VVFKRSLASKNEAQSYKNVWLLSETSPATMPSRPSHGRHGTFPQSREVSSQFDCGCSISTAKKNKKINNWKKYRNFQLTNAKNLFREKPSANDVGSYRSKTHVFVSQCVVSVFFNFFCYGAPFKDISTNSCTIFTDTSPCPPPNCAHVCKYPGLTKQVP